QEVSVTQLQQLLWKSGGATIHVSDIPPGHPDFVAVQWWGQLGGLHGLEPSPAKPGLRGKHIASQYYEAFPGHALRGEELLTQAVREHWTELLSAVGIAEPKTATTRLRWIRAAWNAAGRPGG
ncbi:MAG: FAD-dependent oxidoreductase, partial [Planctomycetaceae bacterium]